MDRIKSGDRDVLVVSMLELNAPEVMAAAVAAVDQGVVVAVADKFSLAKDKKQLKLLDAKGAAHAVAKPAKEVLEALAAAGGDALRAAAMLA
jgi:hypothetical protein